MFEKNIQRSWVNYRFDFGIGRISLIICLFNLFLFLLSVLLFGAPVYEVFYPVVLSVTLIHYYDILIRLSDSLKFIIINVFLTFSVLIDYYYIGSIDMVAGGFKRFDLLFANLDRLIFGRPIAEFLLDCSLVLGPFRGLYYDFLQFSYLTYFFFPFFGGWFYYRQLTDKNKYKISRFVGSIALFFSFNYFLYLIVPVSGPQYFELELKDLHLPFSTFGQFMNQLVKKSHPNFIDCFPSGHAGIAILVTYWMFKIKNHYRYIFLLFCFGMILATISLKYHYLLDVICAIPFSILCFYLSFYLIPLNYDMRVNRKWRI